MKSFPESMSEYKKQLSKGDIIQAHQGLMDYFRVLRSFFENEYPDYSVPGNIYYGYMDMTYFSIIPESLKTRRLKIALVFNYEAFRFEVWLAAKNKGIQTKYWQLIKHHNWNKFHVVPETTGYDSIIENVLVDDPDFSDLDQLTEQINKKTMEFITAVEDFLTKIPNVNHP